jgi:endonuclease YncB( thermonuclease family)
MNSLSVTTRFIWLLLGMLLVLGFWYLQENVINNNVSVPVKLINVIDGDTIVVSIGEERETVRIVAIDTPEFGECYFNNAQVRLLELLKQPFTLHKKPLKNRDTYDRLLRYIEVNGKDVGSILIEEGYAEHWDRDQHPLFHEYQRLEAQAKKEENGQWKNCLEIWSKK